MSPFFVDLRRAILYNRHRKKMRQERIHLKICSFGSLNLDHIYSVEEIVRPGETISSSGTKDVCGGKGLNQSTAMARAGACVWHAGNVGQDAAGDVLVSALEKEGVNTSLIGHLPMPSGQALIQVNAHGENAIIVFGGANQAVTQAQIDEVFAQFEPGDLLVLQNEVNNMPAIVRCAHERGMKIALNPSPITPAIAEIPVELCDILFVNEIEAGQFCGVEKATLEQLAERFPSAMLVYTMGSRGAAVYADGKTYVQPACRVKAVDTTGAGDTFTGYFLAAICEGKEIPEALLLATKASAISVTRPGASVSVPMRAEVENWNPEA